MAFGQRSLRLRRRILGRVSFRLWTWKALPLAAFAGVRLVGLDSEAAVVRLPGGWRSQNPFRSTYFAAQAMAAELSTGAPLLVLAADSSPSIATLVTGLEARFAKKLVGVGLFTCADVPALRDAVARAASQDEPVEVVARSTGRDARGDVVSEWAVTWSLKRRSTV
jgi:ABC-type sugar transport system substrate-binding protein